MSTRVAWATLQAAETEHVISVMLCRENPSAMRIRPSQGDGGIDVITVTPAGWVVDQIKYFSASLTASQRTQVRNSFERLRAYAASQGADIAEWHLVVPVDPTNEERIWFDGLTANAGYPCEWHGLSHVEGLAAKYQDVIDYYLHNGRQRLEALVGQLNDTIRLGYLLPSNNEGQPLTPSEVQSGLAGLYAALNAHDPHYRYSFSVDADFPEVHDEPFLVAARMKKTDVACVTFRIYALLNVDEAEQERPAPGTMQFSFADDSLEAEALRGHYDFGAPATVEDPDGDKIEWSVDLPGGLGGTFLGGRFTLGPARTCDAERYRIRIQILDPDGQQISVCGLQMEPVTTGISGVGVRANGVEEHNAFRLEIRINTVTQVVNLIMATDDLTGRYPVDVLPGLRVAAAFHPPNLVRFAAPYGPMTGPADPIPGPIDLDLGRVLPFVEALAVIQDHTSEQITIPNLTTVTRGDAGGLARVAHLLREGSAKVRWTPFDLRLPKAPAAAGDRPGPMSIERPCTVHLNGREIALGTVRYELASAQIESVTPMEDGVVRVRFVPGEDQTATLVYEPPQPG
jgi:hypothetical protein